jgi:hypothetical protein
MNADSPPAWGLVYEFLIGLLSDLARHLRILCDEDAAVGK